MNERQVKRFQFAGGWSENEEEHRSYELSSMPNRPSNSPFLAMLDVQDLSSASISMDIDWFPVF